MEFWRQSWATSVEKFSSRSWIRSGVISCAPHTSFIEINDSIVKSEHYELVRGSDPPLVYTGHTTADDVCRAPTRLLLLNVILAAGVWKTWTKLSIISQGATNKTLRGLDGRRTARATSSTLEHGSTYSLRRFHLHSCDPVRNEEGWSWVVSISGSKINRVW